LNRPDSHMTVENMISSCWYDGEKARIAHFLRAHGFMSMSHNCN
jgi:hypothetical protein